MDSIGQVDRSRFNTSIGSNLSVQRTPEAVGAKTPSPSGAFGLDITDPAITSFSRLSPAATPVRLAFGTNTSSTNRMNEHGATSVSPGSGMRESLLAATREMENQAKMKETESFLILKHQLAQVQQIRLDSERKDKVIEDLLQYKKEALNLRSELGVMEQRSRLREDNHRKQLDELTSRISQLQSDITEVQSARERAEHDSSQVMKTYATRVAELETALANSQADKERISQESATKTSTINDLRNRIAQLQEGLATQQAEREKLELKLNDRQDEISNLNKYMKKKAHDMALLEEEKNRQLKRLLETQGQLQSETTENQALVAQLHTAEQEIENNKKHIQELETHIMQLHKRVQESEDKIAKQLVEAGRRDKELEKANSLAKAFAEAHSRANKQILDLDVQLQSSKHQTQMLEKELQEAKEREENDLIERQEWAKERLNLLTMRLAAESDLKEALEQSVSPQDKRGNQQQTQAKQGKNDSIGDIQQYLYNLDARLDQSRHSSQQ